MVDKKKMKKYVGGYIKYAFTTLKYSTVSLSLPFFYIYFDKSLSWEFCGEFVYEYVYLLFFINLSSF